MIGELGIEDIRGPGKSGGKYTWSGEGGGEEIEFDIIGVGKAGGFIFTLFLEPGGLPLLMGGGTVEDVGGGLSVEDEVGFTLFLFFDPGGRPLPRF